MGYITVYHYKLESQVVSNEIVEFEQIINKK